MTASPPPAVGHSLSQNQKLSQTAAFSTLLKRCSIVYLCAVLVAIRQKKPIGNLKLGGLKEGKVRELKRKGVWKLVYENKRGY